MIFQNVHIITGNLGNDVQLDVTKDGKRVVHMRVATEYRTNYQGAQRTTLTWHSVTLWGVLAERVSHWRKGDLVHIEGPVFEREMKPADDSKPRKMRELWADVAYRIDTGQEASAGSATTPAGGPRPELPASAYEWPV